MNGITEAKEWNNRSAHFCMAGYHSFHNETTKSTFNSYNLFPAVHLIQNRINVLFIVHNLRFPSSRLARKNMLEK